MNPTTVPQFRMFFNASNKIQAIKTVRNGTNLGLKEAKDLVEAAMCASTNGIAKQGVVFENLDDLTFFLNNVVLADANRYNRNFDASLPNDAVAIYDVRVEAYVPDSPLVFARHNDW